MSLKIRGLTGRLLRLRTKGIWPKTGSKSNFLPPNCMKNELCPSQTKASPFIFSKEWRNLISGFHFSLRFSFLCGLGESLHFKTLPIPCFTWCCWLINFPLTTGFPFHSCLIVVNASFRRKEIGWLIVPFRYSVTKIRLSRKTEGNFLLKNLLIMLLDWQNSSVPWNIWIFLL